MANRTLIPYFNASEHGEGIEGFSNWANITMDYWMFPLFLLVMWGLAIYHSTRNEWHFGPQLLLYSTVAFILGMQVQTWTMFNQLVMFIFVIGIIVGFVMSFIEKART